ncbi:MULTISPECIES: DUF2301 domain-containing membrane protein [Vibrio]|jgi:uncharacterized integral membrane protein|uniref:Membrane protein n=1 Tax=Vibrio rotiferianus TaxID=190895 RepID=A0A2K7T0X0_9VIBR|nr:MULTISPECIES: DUF2301 domain-containing membrane protein [Vibrio]ASI93667.1 hypothetical protein BSZ04_01185 [Vibrio rotiferianus]MDK9777339.1 hypothetical protein [Vibrio sp. D401a]MDK9801256.1 hypothetical protein [Vibrio sp. D406a]OHY96391.1 hypothetical protein BI375_02435 [Vibrio rotiferianus]TMX57089.1 hypothetical protein DA097_22700 [Vibrio rotiferianus]
MANTEYQETLDLLDKLSVCLYRLGITLFAVALLCFSIIVSGAITSSLFVYQASLIALCVASALSAANIHVYNKHVRAAISWASWIGLVLMVSDLEFQRTWLGLGFIFVTFSGIALKESFCFKVPGLKMVPVFLAVATFALWFNLPILAAITMLLAGLVMGFLSFAKWRMPLHFDIGIKANYEI